MIPNHSFAADEHSSKPDKPEEACGVFGIYAPGEDVAKLTYFGLYALQHRGQESAGIATFDGEKVHLHKDMGLVSQVFNESSLGHLPGNLAVRPHSLLYYGLVACGQRSACGCRNSFGKSGFST